MYAIALLQGMVFYGPVATLYREAQGVSIAQITLIESISLALCILLEVPWGILADKLGYKNTMVACCFLYFLSKIVFWQATGFGGFLLERIMLSVVTAGLSGVDALCTFGLTEVKPPAPFSARLTLEVLRQTLSHRRLLIFLLAGVLMSEAHQTITTFLNQLQYARCGLPDEAIGLLYVAATVAGMAGIWSARLTHRTGKRGTALLLYGGGTAACVVLALTFSPLPSICAILGLRLCHTLFQPFLMELQNQQVTTPHRATALSVHAMLMDGVGVGTNLVFGALAEVNLSWAFWFGGVLCLAGLALFFKWDASRPQG